MLFTRYGLIAALLLLSLVLSTELKTPQWTVLADPAPKFSDIERFQCVTEVGPAQNGSDNPFTPAIYRTVINVYNPQTSTVSFTMSAVIARSLRSPQGLISPAQTGTLQPGAAIGIDCVDIQTLLGGTQPVGNGVWILQAGQALKVIPAYTQLTPPLT